MRIMKSYPIEIICYYNKINQEELQYRSSLVRKYTISKPPVFMKFQVAADRKAPFGTNGGRIYAWLAESIARSLGLQIQWGKRRRSWKYAFYILSIKNCMKSWPSRYTPQGLLKAVSVSVESEPRCGLNWSRRGGTGHCLALMKKHQPFNPDCLNTE